MLKGRNTSKYLHHFNRICGQRELLLGWFYFLQHLWKRKELQVLGASSALPRYHLAKSFFQIKI